MDKLGPQVSLQKMTKLGVSIHMPVYGCPPQPGATARHPATACAVFLDRDGVLVEDVHFLKEPGQLRILPGVLQALRKLQDRFHMFVVTNQSGIARGILTEEELEAIHLELVERLWTEGIYLDGLYYCPHLREGTVPAYRLECDCRKPKPGMLLRAGDDWGIDLAGSFMMGDNPRDVEAARAAGVTGILIGADPRGPEEPTMTADDLAQATDLLLATSSNRPNAPGAEPAALTSQHLGPPAQTGLQ